MSLPKKCGEKGCRKKVTRVIRQLDCTVYHHAARFNHKLGALVGGLCVVPKLMASPSTKKLLAVAIRQEQKQRERDFHDL